MSTPPRRIRHNESGRTAEIMRIGKFIKPADSTVRLKWDDGEEQTIAAKSLHENFREVPNDPRL